MTPRTIADFEALTGDQALREGERRLIEACKKGELCELSTERPTAWSGGNRVRADLLRLLILGGSSKCGLHEQGVQLSGAWIDGQLDLGFTKANGRTILLDSHFTHEPFLEHSELLQLSLSGSAFPGLWAEWVIVRGAAVFDGCHSEATISMIGARIDGDLSFMGATIEGLDGQALQAQGITVGQDLRFSALAAKGCVNVSGATIEGQLDCSYASFEHGSGFAFLAQKLRVKEAFYWRDLRKVSGTVNLNGAYVGDLSDDLQSWPVDSNLLRLDGFSYDRIALGPTYAAIRRPWLLAGSVTDGRFHPQPYTQLAKTLAFMGHVRDSHRIRMAAIEDRATHQRSVRRMKRKLMRDLRRASKKSDQANLFRLQSNLENLPAGIKQDLATLTEWFVDLHGMSSAAPQSTFSVPVFGQRVERRQFRDDMRRGATKHRIYIALNWTADFIMRWSVGYGYAPLRAAACLAALWIVAWVLAALVWSEGSFAPNSDVVLVSQGWVEATEADCIGPLMRQLPSGFKHCDPNPASTWSAKAAPGMDWDSFSAWGYGLDLVVPILTLGQTDAWAPSKDRGWLGWTLWWGRWILEAAGWIITALGAAAIAGIMQRGRE